MEVIDLCDSPLAVPVVDDGNDRNQQKTSIFKSSYTDLHHGELAVDNSVAECCWQPFYLNSLRREALSPPGRLSNSYNCLSLCDIISSADSSIIEVVILTYDLNIEWLLATVPLLTCTPSLILHGGDKKIDMHGLDNLVMSPVDMGSERFGTHHNKIIFVFYSTGVRVAITTANLTEVDWTFKIQGTYVQDFPRKESTSSSEFECSLLAHCERIIPMGIVAQRKWLLIQQQLQHYDYESAEVVLISSVPGRHVGPNRSKWGQWKLKEELSMSCSDSEDDAHTRRLLMQFSSIGSLKANESFLEELAGSMNAQSSSDLSANIPRKKQKTSETKGMKRDIGMEIEVVWPTVNSVRGSAQGWGAGFSLPCQSKNMYETASSMHIKSGLADRLCRYDSYCTGRGLFTPHMKCYFSYKVIPKIALSDNCQSDRNDGEEGFNSVMSNSKDFDIHLEWFLLTSANLSQAAWGVSEKNDSQLYIKSFEIGVLFLPQRIVTTKRLFSCTPDHPILGLKSTKNRGDKDQKCNKNVTKDASSIKLDRSGKKRNTDCQTIDIDSSSIKSDRYNNRKRSTFLISSKDLNAGNGRLHDESIEEDNIVDQSTIVHFPIPFKVPPDPYVIDPIVPYGDLLRVEKDWGKGDHPWVWDRNYENLKDRFGRTLSEYR